MDISVGSGGGSSSGPLQFIKNSSTVTVTQDTVTPANNIPLPVQLYGTSGTINITAGDINVQLSDQGANPDVTRIGDGTTQLGITVSNEAKVADSTARTSLASIDTKTPALGQALAAASTPVVLPATQITALTPPTTVTVTQATGSNLHAVLDSGSTTAVTQATAANLNATIVGTGTFATQVTSLPSIPTGANTIGAISNTSFAATQATAANLNATVVGTGTFATQVTSLPSIPTGANVIGSISNTSFAATQATAASLNATVVQGAAGASAWKVDGSAVTQPVSGSVTASTPAGALTDRSGTCSATPLTATTLAAVNASRKYLFIENNSTLGDIYINFTTSATATNSIVLKPFASFEMNGNFVSTELVSVASNAASATFSAKEG